MTPSFNDFESESRDTARYFAALREHWLLVVLILAVAMSASVAYGATRPKSYEAEADVLVTPVPPDEALLDGLGLLRDPSGSVFTAARLLETPQVTNRVIRRLDLSLSRRALLEKLKIIPLPQSNLVAIQATDGTASGAAALANEAARALLAERTGVFQSRRRSILGRLQKSRAAIRTANARDRAAAGELDDRIRFLQSFEGAADPTLAIWTAAVTPDVAKPRSVFGYVAGFFAALILASGLALLLEILSPRIRREYELPTSAVVLTRVPHLPRRAISGYLAGRRALPRNAWEAYRVLRAGIAGVGAVDGSQVILVTSAIKGEGKTTTSANAAIAFAASGSRVILVDANLRDQRIARIFGAQARESGLVEILAGHASLEEALLPAGPDHPNLWLLLAGDTSVRGVDLLERGRVERLVAEARDEADVIVIDSPSLTEFAEATALADAADLVVVAARLGRSRQDALAEAMRMLARRGVHVAGMVLTDRRRLRRRKIVGAEPMFGQTEPVDSLPAGP